MTVTLLLAVSAPSFGASGATAEVKAPETTAPEKTAPVDCRASADQQPGAAPDAPLPETSVLDACSSVLKPPVSADQEMVEHPTHGGETPVIDPEVVPAPAEE